MPGAAFYGFTKNPSTFKVRSQFVSRPFLGIIFSCSFLTYNLQELLLHPISSHLIFLILKIPNNSFLSFPPSPLWRRTLIITCMPRQLLQNQWKYLMLEAAWGNRLISQTANIISEENHLKSTTAGWNTNWWCFHHFQRFRNDTKQP